MTVVSDVFLSFLGSALALVVLYIFYWYSFHHCSAKKAYAQCWWLPGWNCFRFVIRNMHSDENLMEIKYRVWLRSIQSARLGSSVKTFEDNEIVSGERILLPGKQDLPVLCFRFEPRENNIKFIYTDKFGTLIRMYDIKPEVDSLMVEYYLKIQRWFLFKHEIARIFEIPHYLEANGKKVDLFQAYLMNKQSEREQEIRLVFKKAELITVAV